MGKETNETKLKMLSKVKVEGYELPKPKRVGDLVFIDKSEMEEDLKDADVDYNAIHTITNIRTKRKDLFYYELENTETERPVFIRRNSDVKYLFIDAELVTVTIDNIGGLQYKKT